MIVEVIITYGPCHSPSSNHNSSLPCSITILKLHRYINITASYNSKLTTALMSSSVISISPFLFKNISNIEEMKLLANWMHAWFIYKSLKTCLLLNFVLCISKVWFCVSTIFNIDYTKHAFILYSLPLDGYGTASKNNKSGVIWAKLNPHWVLPLHVLRSRTEYSNTWFTPETCLKCMQIKTFTCGTRLNKPENHTYFIYKNCHVWKISHQIQVWNFSHKFTYENVSRIPTIPHCVSINYICSFKHTFKQSHPTKQIWVPDEISLPFANFENAMDICCIFFSSNEYVK